MDTNIIKEKFDLVAQNYDEQRSKFIPCYYDYYFSMIDFISKSFSEPEHIVDLGAGTGLLAKFFYDKYPNARYTLIDISEQMLKVAKERFIGKDAFEYIVSDYTKELVVNDSDLIISGLSIHHLENTDKQKLYNSIYKTLPNNGVFINFDQFNSKSELVNQMYNKYWYDQIINSGLPESEYKKWSKRRELDNENTIDDTKELLVNAGFSIVECIYSYMKFGVIVAQKIT